RQLRPRHHPHAPDGNPVGRSYRACPRSGITMKGDTIEYDASAFEIRPNDKVEDLLKRLPGRQVDGNGRITAQGQAVGKVLLDGEEFFADDPTLSTRNVRADMVDKIQVYEKKSARAEL